MRSARIARRSTTVAIAVLPTFALDAGYQSWAAEEQPVGPTDWAGGGERRPTRFPNQYSDDEDAPETTIEQVGATWRSTWCGTGWS